MTVPTVLVADDDRSIRTVLTQALGRSGYQVRSTGNAATLWRWVEESSEVNHQLNTNTNILTPQSRLN